MIEKVKIDEVKTDLICPRCDVALVFENSVYSKKQVDERSEYYRKMVKTKLFRYLKIGRVFHEIEEAMKMRCPKCQKLYHVERNEVK